MLVTETHYTAHKQKSQPLQRYNFQARRNKNFFLYELVALSVKKGNQFLAPTPTTITGSAGCRVCHRTWTGWLIVARKAQRMSVKFRRRWTGATFSNCRVYGQIRDNKAANGRWLRRRTRGTEGVLLFFKSRLSGFWTAGSGVRARTKTTTDCWILFVSFMAKSPLVISSFQK